MDNNYRKLHFTLGDAFVANPANRPAAMLLGRKAAEILHRKNVKGATIARWNRLGGLALRAIHQQAA